MPQKANMIRVEALRAELEAVIRSIQGLEQDGSLLRLASQDPGRWEAVLDALSATMDRGQSGTVQQALDAVTAALQQP